MTFKTGINVFLWCLKKISEKELLRMVREVSEDRIYDTIEFNEFLQMMSKQMRNYTQDSLRDAFRYSSPPHDDIWIFHLKKCTSTTTNSRWWQQRRLLATCCCGLQIKLQLPLVLVAIEVAAFYLLTVIAF